MINNDALFDHFRNSRKRGHRTGWSVPNPILPRVTAHYGMAHGMPEPAQVIYEADMLDDSAYANCSDCGEHDYAAMLHNDLCSYCVHANSVEWQDTLAAINREEYAMRGGPLVR